MSSHYPPGPLDVPRDFTRLTGKYRLQVVLVLISLFLSFALYLGLLVGSAWLCKWLVTLPSPPRADRGFEFMRVLGIIASALLFLYLLKGLFKGSGQDESLLVEITEEEQPELFAFIRRVCAETKAPFPHKVYVSPEVNAAVFYHSSLLSLFWPTPKNLLIGLGLVNMLNLSEFKAVLAHEFGHFSQKSMKVGTYVYVANRVLGDIIYGRDFLDDLLSQAKNLDLRIALFVYAFLGILWVLRKIMEGVFKGLNLLNLSLMRQMEFNADRVAVSVAGSDAIVTSLLRSSYADQAFRRLAEDLWSAADHQLYSRDIFAHQLAAGNQVRRLMKKPMLGDRPADRGPDVQVFNPEEEGMNMPPMWATHPSNADREAHAKSDYLAADEDDRPALLLFRNQDALRQEVSKRYYQTMHRLEIAPRLAAAEEVQRFLDEEYAETTYDERYGGLYDNRYLEIADLSPLLTSAGAPSRQSECLAEIDRIFTTELAAWVEEHQKRLGDFDLLAGLLNGQLSLKGATLPFRGEEYGPRDYNSLFETVQRELEEDRARHRDIDERVFLAHCRLARLDPACESDLIERYRFHLAIQGMHTQVRQAMDTLQGALQYANGRRELSQDEFAQLRAMMGNSVQLLHDALKAARKKRIPVLKNIEPGQDLREFLLQKPPVKDLSLAENSIPPEWITQLMNQLLELQDKLKRLLFKSLGGILAAQENIVQRCRQLPPLSPIQVAADPATPAAR